MRPCQFCGQPLSNRVAICPACQREQQATVGLQRRGAGEGAGKPAGRPPDLERLDRRIAWTVLGGYWCVVACGLLLIWLDAGPAEEKLSFSLWVLGIAAAPFLVFRALYLP